MNENYFWHINKNENSNKVFVLIIYDIVENKIRNKFYKKMKGYGFQVQKSAFEAIISDSLYKKLLKEVPKLINTEKDSVRIYKMTGYGEIKLFGCSINIENEETVII
ncbi:CRISPR-associated endonuclease Cas2 [Fusobacterium hominis]|uniref:CRISPR-associated endonuclease Cas2 n=1 Tax=Fusobacterium hominis TaxID=2764326 RepID=UPI0015A0F7C5|nr:CRISPR-associated endonuclease Cas2 [Fusobacterium hominis]